MGNFKLTGLAAGTVNGDSVRYEQVVGQYLPIAGGTLTGTLNLTGALNLTGTLNLAKGTAVASAATTNIWATDGNLIHVTGTGGPITSFGTAPQAGAKRTVVIDSAGVVITNGANLFCPEGKDIVSSAGDILEVVADTTSQHRVTSYVRAGSRTFFGSFTKDMSAASTTQVITGVGFRPKKVRFYMADPTTGNSIPSSIGEDNGTSAFCVFDSHNIAVNSNAIDTSRSIRAQGAGGSQTGYITAFSNDGFTVTWTRNTTGPTMTGTIQYVAEM